MNSLGVSMIVRGEESVLERALQSVIGADELVIVDTGLPSDEPDKTGEIAVKYTDKYFPYEFEWRDNFAEARNYALSKNTTDWILTLDADFFLEVGGIEKIREAIATAAPGEDGFYIDCWNHDSDCYTHQLILVYRRSPNVFWNAEAHNWLSILSNRRIDTKMRYTYSPAHAKDPDRALRILKNKVDKDRDTVVREKYYLAREYWYRSDYITAAYWYEEYLKKAYFPPEMADAWLMLAKCYFSLWQGDRARDCCMKAIALNTDFKEAIQFMAQMSGPGNAKRWLEFAEGASNEGALFTR